MKLLILAIATGMIVSAQSTTYGLTNVGKTDISRGAVVLPGATFASAPSSPSAHDTYRFTDASALGNCSGGGSAIALCEWSGSAWVAISGGGSGGGTSDCTVTASGAVITIATPCHISIGGIVQTLGGNATATLSGTSTNGTVYVYWDSAGGLRADESTAATLTCNANCTVATNGGFPSGSFWLATVPFTANVTGTVVDLRSYFSNKSVYCGAGLTCGENGSTGELTMSAETTNALLTKATYQAAAPVRCASSTGSMTYTCGLTPALNPGYTTGMVVEFTPTVAAVTGAATLNIDGFGAKAIKKSDGTTDPGSDVAIGQQLPLRYDGTVFRLPATGSSSAASYTPLPASGAGLLPFIPKIGLVQLPTNSTFGDVVNTVYGFTFQAPTGGMTIANTAIEVISGAPAGGRLRYKIVNQAGTVLADSGALSTAIETAGVKSSAFSQVTIPEGVYTLQYATSDISTLTTRDFYFVPTYRIDSPTTGLATGYKLFGSMGVSASGAGAAYNFTAQALSAMTNDNGLGYIPIFAFWK